MANPSGVKRVTSLGDEARAMVLFDPRGRPIDLARVGEDSFEEAGVGIAPDLPAGSEAAAWPVPFGVNYQQDPRGGYWEKALPFDILKGLSRFDYVRAIIEDIKGQVCGMQYGIRPVEGVKKTDALLAKASAIKARIKLIDPRANLSYRAWMSLLVEEMLVTDAVSLHPRTDRALRPIGLKRIDGATIRPRVNDLGDPPLPPETAYWQFDKGRARRGFTTQTLWYRPRNPQLDNPYGFPPTESVILTISVAMRNLLGELTYQAEGNIPDAVYSLATTAAPKQLREFQEWWDLVVKASADLRRGQVRFLPPGTWTDTKNRQWSYEFVELFVRIMCHAFQVSNVYIAKQMNRSTSETMELSSLEAGPRRIAEHASELLTAYVQGPLDAPDLEFFFHDDETEMPADSRERQKFLLGRGATTINRVREQNGEDPIEPEIGDEPLWDTPTGPIFLRDMAKTRMEAASQDAVRIDPSKIQRAFLEAPILRRDEVRAAVGAAPLGGPEGEEFISIALQPPGEPAPGGAPGSGGSAPASAATRDAAPSGSPAADLEKALGAWRRMALPRVREGKPLRKFLDRPGEIVPGSVRARVEWGLRRVPRAVGPDALALARSVFDLAKAERSPSAELPAVTTAKAELQAIVQEWLDSHRDAIVAEAVGQLPTESLAKASRRGEVSASQFDMSGIIEDLEAALSRLTTAAADEAADAIGVDFETAPAQALAWARQHAAEMVGMHRLEDGSLVENPDKTWAINETLRADVNERVERALAEGWSPQQLKTELTPQFGPWRAEAIARAETGMSLAEGAAAVYEENDVAHVLILDGDGCTPSGHDDAAPAPDGLVGVVQEDRQANGQIWTIAQYRAHPIGHPNCVRGSAPHFQGR